MNPYPKRSIAWQDPPIEPDLPLVPILSPKPGQPVYAIITGSEIRGVVTHYIGNRTRPCTGDETQCEGCLSGRAKRWKGYLAGELPPTGRAVLVELTYEAYRGCKALHGIGAKLQGRKITLTRCGKASNAKVKAEVGPQPDATPNLQSFDVERALLRIWFGEGKRRPLSGARTFDQTMKRLTHDVGGMPAD